MFELETIELADYMLEVREIAEARMICRFLASITW